MANRHERRTAEAVRRKNAAKAAVHEEALRLRERRASSVGSTIGELPNYRGDEPQHSEIK